MQIYHDTIKFYFLKIVHPLPHSLARTNCSPLATQFGTNKLFTPCHTVWHKLCRFSLMQSTIKLGFSKNKNYALEVYDMKLCHKKLCDFQVMFHLYVSKSSNMSTLTFILVLVPVLLINFPMACRANNNLQYWIKPQ